MLADPAPDGYRARFVAGPGDVLRLASLPTVAIPVDAALAGPDRAPDRERGGTELRQGRTAVAATGGSGEDGPMMRRPLKVLLLVVAVAGGGMLIARLLGYRLGPRTIVRCRQGHLFTTVWIPGVKLKALDLVVARVQRCPVGQHWTLVTPVKESDLTDEERATALAHHDTFVP